MERIRFLPFVVAALVIAALVAARFMTFNTAQAPAKPPPQPAINIPIAEPQLPLAQPLAPINAPEIPAMSQPSAAIPVVHERNHKIPVHRDPAPVAGDPKETPAANTAEIKWQVAYKDEFNKPESIKKYALLSLSNPPGELEWHEKHKAMMLRNNDNGGGEIFAAVRKSLPGDLRVRFKAMCRKSETEVSIGIMFSVAGALRTEDGYFAEWAGGSTKLKKHNIQQAGEQAPTPQTADRWVNLELRRIGAKITMYMEGKEVTAWTDDQPVQGAQHDLLSFYVWSETTLIKDLIIERNANDPLKPLTDDPAADDNMLRGLRNQGSSTQMESSDF
jgi:hypothetical protein